ncbi:hypothetical protein [Demequina aurantiaca]|uniref:hypothetical protein n=1 Tax=Demequina aurantiaca TaxID=676200 RepID=UPI003D356899
MTDNAERQFAAQLFGNAADAPQAEPPPARGGPYVPQQGNPVETPSSPEQDMRVFTANMFGRKDAGGVYQ